MHEPYAGEPTARAACQLLRRRHLQDCRAAANAASRKVAEGGSGYSSGSSSNGTPRGASAHGGLDGCSDEGSSLDTVDRHPGKRKRRNTPAT